jgi:hypothetical protein
MKLESAKFYEIDVRNWFEKIEQALDSNKADGPGFFDSFFSQQYDFKQEFEIAKNEVLTEKKVLMPHLRW